MEVLEIFFCIFIYSNMNLLSSQKYSFQAPRFSCQQREGYLISEN